MIRYSIVIATYNRAFLLTACLNALANQTISKKEYEVLLIDDGSVDNTEEVARNFIKSNKDLNLLYLKQKNAGVAKARNRGIQNASGEIIFFTDDDCIVPPTWIEIIATEHEKNPDVACVGGWYRYDKNLYKSKMALAYIDFQYITFHRSYFKGLKLWPEEKIISSDFRTNPAGNTSNTAYKKSALEKTGGFDESINFVGLVDWELRKRIMDLGHQFIYIPLHVIHVRPFTPNELVRRMFNKGRGSYHFSKKNKEFLTFYYPKIAGRTFMRYLNSFLIKQGDHTDNNASGKFYIFAIAVINRILRRLGWEYQRFIENIYKMHG